MSTQINAVALLSGMSQSANISTTILDSKELKDRVFALA